MREIGRPEAVFGKPDDDGTKLLSESDMLEKVAGMQDEGIRILAYPQKDFPTDFDYAGFESSKHPRMTEHIQDEVEDLISACKRFLSGPIIADTFPDHGARMQWFNSKVPEYGRALTDLHMKNRMRWNALLDVSNSVHLLANACRIYQLDSERATAFKAIASQLPDVKDYPTMQAEEKIEIVKKVSQFSTELLKLFAKPAEQA